MKTLNIFFATPENNIHLSNDLVVNCLNFGDPLTCIGDFKNHIDLMNDQCKELNIPVLGGNVSMYNTTNGIDIPSSVVIVMIGLKDKIN